jgi:signal transduction histidine kinase
MKSQTLLCESHETRERIKLHQLVDHLMAGLAPEAVNRKSLIINDVNPWIPVNTDENMLAFVIVKLLTTVVNQTESNCIHIDAISTGNFTSVQVRDHISSARNNYVYGLGQVQDLLQKLGGAISVSSSRTRGTVVAFSFNNAQSAA